MAEGRPKVRRGVVAGMGDVVDRAIRRSVRAAPDGRWTRGWSDFARCTGRLCPTLTSVVLNTEAVSAQPVSGKPRQRSVLIVSHASGRQIVGARGHRLVAARQPEIGLLHRRSFVREIFALDANNLAQRHCRRNFEEFVRII